MYFLRFTNNPDETRSFDHFENVAFEGVCAFALDCEEDELRYSIRKAAEKDNTYLKYYNGEFIVFEGRYIKDNPYGNGVIAEKAGIVLTGKLEWNDKLRTYVFK